MSSGRSTRGRRSGPRAEAALLMRMSMRPNSLRVRSTMAVMLDALVTSSTKGRARRPSARTESATLSMPRQPISCSSGGKVEGSRPVPVTTTSQPARARDSATARPKPRMRPTPVTIATLPSSSVMKSVYVPLAPHPNPLPPGRGDTLRRPPWGERDLQLKA